MNAADIKKILDNKMTKKLNIGCGQRLMPCDSGWVNIDFIDHPEVIKADIFDLPLPFEDNHFDFVMARHVLEHVPHNIPKYGHTKNFLQLFMEEIWRIMKPGGIIEIESPIGLSTFVDSIDHKRIISVGTFHIFFPGSPWNYYSECRFEPPTGWNRTGFAFGITKTIFRAFGIDIRALKSGPDKFHLRKLHKET